MAGNSNADLMQSVPAKIGSELAGFTEALFRAVDVMARRSRRGQADVFAALRGAGLTTEHPGLGDALQMLLAQGRVSNPLTLSDGGTLVTVTGMARRLW